MQAENLKLLMNNTFIVPKKFWVFCLLTFCVTHMSAIMANNEMISLEKGKDLFWFTVSELSTRGQGLM
jgi:hypothetical protein